MAIEPGSRIGGYEILALVGAGGMGEVYRARDTKLQRDVAVKVIPDLAAADPARRARFQREARLLASLSHTNIAAVHGVEDNPLLALVMELVEGDTLADRLVEGPLPLPEALEIARQLADALAAAHEQRIVHRDLKPSNVKIRADGTVKVLDFGLARALESDGAPGTTLLESTVTEVGVGAVLGTAPYMSPEQARGEPVDHRADIWAFGCLVFEMLTGERAFDGDSGNEALAAVLRGEPDWTRLPAETPEAVRRLLRRCLAKDAMRRLVDIRDARLELDEADATPGTIASHVPRPSRRRERLAWTAAALAAAAALWAVLRTSDDPPSAPSRFVIEAPPGTTFGAEGAGVAVSPDGRQLVFVASGTDGVEALWLRPLASPELRRLPGAELAHGPFWSPDSRSIGFFAAGKLKTVDAAGGAVRTLADTGATASYGGTWNDDDVILFAPAIGRPLHRIDASGGEPVPASALRDSATSHAWPSFLPDGRRFLFVARRGPVASETHLGSLDSAETVPLPQTYGAPVVFAPPGYLLYLRSGVLVAQRFDARTGTLQGDAVPISDSTVAPRADAFVGAPFLFRVSAARSGTLAYGWTTANASRPARMAPLVWVDRQGTPTEIAPAGDFTHLTLAPDGRTVAFDRIDEQRGIQVWTYDIARNAASRLTDRSDMNNVPVWAPDGNTLAFATRRHSTPEVFKLDIHRASLTGGDRDEPVALLGAAALLFPTHWSVDGVLAYDRTGATTQFDIWVLPPGTDTEPRPFLQTQYSESQGQFSPDGQWLAYVSDLSGRPEVYASPYPSGAGRVLISTNGGGQPRWNPNGRELFYLAADGKLMSVAVDAGETLTAQPPQTLFDASALRVSSLRQAYDVAPDGERFVMQAPVDASPPVLTVVVDWTALLR